MSDLIGSCVFEVADDAGEVTVRCTCGHLFQRLTPEKMKAILKSDKIGRRECPKCRAVLGLGLYTLANTIYDSQNRTRNHNVQKFNFIINFINKNDGKILMPDEDTQPDHNPQRWQKQGFTLVCTGRPGLPCGNQFASLQVVSSEEGLAIYKRQKDISVECQTTRYREFLPDFIPYPKRFVADDLAEFVTYTLTFGLNVFNILVGELSCKDENPRVNAIHFDLRGGCLHCGTWHILPGVFRFELLNLWREERSK